MDKVRTAVVGLGSRGYGILCGLALEMDNVEVTAVCDAYEDRMMAGVQAVEQKTGRKPSFSTDYRDILKKDICDAVLITSAWESHIPIACYAMEQGVAVGMEVGGAYSLDDCWRMVRTQERTGTPFMFLENCCYGQMEMMVMNMVKLGLFGEIVHCEGGYHHDLRDEITRGEENRHYRLRNYLSRNCENYPTHELGPIAQVLNINRGNRMVSLTSTSSKAVGLNAYAATHPDVDRSLVTAKFNQGDVVTTVIKCANGETIVLSLDTCLPRFYSRSFTVKGTKGLYMEDGNCVYLEDDFAGQEFWDFSSQYGNARSYLEKYQHPVWEKYLREGIRGGHGGMDGLVYDAFIEAVRTGTPTPIDVYDAAAWMCITPLSEESIARGSAPVAIPDFTNGAWCSRKA